MICLTQMNSFHKGSLSFFFLVSNFSKGCNEISNNEHMGEGCHDTRFRHDFRREYDKSERQTLNRGLVV